MQLKRAVSVGIAAAACAAIVACGSAANPMPFDSFGRVGGVAPTEDFAPPSAASPPLDPPRCPSDAPAPGSPCSNTGTMCTYGPDIRAHCNERFECKGGRWTHTTPDCASDCPASFDAIVPGTACSDRLVACSYDEGTCGCSGEPDGTGGADAGDDAGDSGASAPVPGIWRCVAPPKTLACPDARPRELDACVKRVSCDYGSCELQRSLRYDCESGLWQKIAKYSNFCDP